MSDFEGLRKLHQAFRPDNKDFNRWYLLLKGCYDLPDYVLAYMVGVFPSHFDQWKRGLRKPSRIAVKTMALLCALRVYNIATAYDIIMLPQRIATGKFEKHVLGYLQHEREVIARRAAKKAEKAAEKAARDTTAGCKEQQKPGNIG